MITLLFNITVLGSVAFVFYTMHLLNALMVMEALVVALFLMMVWGGALGAMEATLVMVLLVVAASAGALGLSILVSICRTHGRDYFSCYSLLW